MIALLLAARAISFSLWLIMLWRFFPSMKRAFRLKQRRALDPIWACIWGLALNRVWFVSHDAIWHGNPSNESEVSYLIVGYVMASMLAATLLQLRGWYDD